jgi:CheY-like chemotaxis protein
MRKVLHNVSAKLTAAQLGVELVLEKVATGAALDANDMNSLHLALKAMEEAGELVNEERELRRVQTAEKPKLSVDGRKSILIVDDDDMVREVIVNIFRNAGYVVYDVANGRAAIDIIANADVDIVLTDLKMPGLTGNDVANEIRNLDRKQPTLCLMSGDTNELRHLQYKVNADGIVQKPFSARVILSAVSDASETQDKTGAA